ncbi:MAG: Gfo/Idh/MocA family oxidoreductase [Crenarchaeota archaeon]|nr:Gfo/Idh/MocA family oxidoreductase [Thermoproteota archaeon]
MKKVITYGTFDLFHQGHYNLLKSAKELGDYLIVGITTDNFDLERGKMNTNNNLMERIESVKDSGLADQIIIEEYQGQKIDDIQKYNVDLFAIGSDWEGFFDYLKEFCDVIYLPRTEGISSTQLRLNRPIVNLGIIGTGSIANRFVMESKNVNNISIEAAYNPDIKEAYDFSKKYELSKTANNLTEFFATCDSVYIASPYFTHYDYVKQSLLHDKNVLCETPFVLTEKEANELYQIAEEKKLVLSVALKTAYCPAFRHLLSLLKSGIIGTIVDLTASVTTLIDDELQKANPRFFGGSMCENSCFPLLPIFKLFGTEYKNITFYSKMKNGDDIFTKAVVQYENAIASFQVGLGVKSEGDLVISGTKGYAYVSAPWWKTNFFEICYEDQNLNKKYFYPYIGEGLRYEIKDFVSSILSKSFFYSTISKRENIAMAKVQENFLAKENLYLI